ncbi:MAG: dipeptide ABC transporter ATP-binding protein [Pseudomonadota bacterium]|nr:dipeptide ABC transporter ATP-binding protein [Pseudomonadota bacterium]MBU1398691.1 dipeptide ABC transporter ATP-binding protein [Pseudomonadota bacterium]MBU1570827.1 dipeptide ABC transporter ATP-binding protein [Pseudomonadota bacterium]
MDSGIIITADNLKRYYKIRLEGFFSRPSVLKALDGVSFTIRGGKTLAVVGESGCGKTTLARLVTMIEQPTSGRLEIKGISGTTGNKDEQKELHKLVQIVFQDPYGSLNPRKKIGSILEEPLKINTGLSASRRREAAYEMLAKVGLTREQYNRYPHMFSGGQRQRIAIARALMLKPALVVADEPVSALDVSVQAQALNLLMDLQDEMNLAYLFISHDLGVVQHIADDLLVMYLGRPAEQGSKAAVFKKPLHPYTRALMGSIPSVNKNLRRKRVRLTGEIPSPLNPPSGCAFHKRCAFMSEICAAQKPELRQVEDRLVACHNAEKVAAIPF